MPNFTLIGADTETYLICPEAPFPKPVCVQLCGEDYAATILVHEGMRETFKALFAPDIISVWHSACYDLQVICQHLPELIPAVLKATKEGRVKCTKIREQMLNLADYGHPGMIECNGAMKHISNSLADCVMRYLNVDIFAGKDEDSWRTHYRELENVPLADWPQDAINYAKDDPIWSLKVYKKQEERRQRLKDTLNIDVLVQEDYRVNKEFLLTFMSNTGTDVEVNRFYEIEQPILDEFNEKNFPLLLENGIYRKAVPEQPHVNGAQEHDEDCFANKKSESYDKTRATGKNKERCGCPPKMSKAGKQGIHKKVLQAFVWDLCETEPEVFTPGFTDKADLAMVGHFNKHGWDSDPDILETLSLKVSVNANFLSEAHLYNTVLGEYHYYQEYSKLVSSYLPSLKDAVETDKPIRSQYSVVKSTGRASAKDASPSKGKPKFYPSWNDQQADPRVRTCNIAPKNVSFDLAGNRVLCDGMDWVMCSIDYTAMELGTWSQRCLDVLGYSDCAELILNKGRDAHQYLGGALAAQFDFDFSRVYVGGWDFMEIYDLMTRLKTLDAPCDLHTFKRTWKDLDHKKPPTWINFYDHYRTFAKPIGLGYPGGLGAKTLVGLAATTYHIKMTVKEAMAGKEIWMGMYREAKGALDYVNNALIDPRRDFGWTVDKDGKKKHDVRYAYSTAHGLYRSNCTYTAAANGMFLQAPGAEGALAGVGKAIEECYAGTNELLKPDANGLQVVPLKFIHDEGIYLVRRDGKESKRAFALADLQVQGMKWATPDVAAGADPCFMFRWDKKAKQKFDADGKLIPWDIDDREIG